MVIDGVEITFENIIIRIGKVKIEEAQLPHFFTSSEEEQPAGAEPQAARRDIPLPPAEPYRPTPPPPTPNSPPPPPQTDTPASPSPPASPAPDTPPKRPPIFNLGGAPLPKRIQQILEKRNQEKRNQQNMHVDDQQNMHVDDVDDDW